MASVESIDDLRQICYLSINPEALRRSRAYVKHFMPWITSTVVVTPERMRDEMRALGDDVTVICDHEVLPPGTDPSRLDHQTLNFRLRVGMCLSGITDDLFVMSDDDYRPMKPVGPERFVTPTGPDGRLQLIGYTFYDLFDWTYESTAFDQGQHNTLQVLAYLGAEQRSYASHQPQAIDRELFIEAASMCQRVAPGVAVDEWAVHFNLGRMLDPERFTEPKPYVTLGWPEYPNIWRRAVVPTEYVFENFYPDLYQDGYLYAGLSTEFDAESVERESVEKLRRWRRLDLQTRRLTPNPTVHYPWKRSPRRLKTMRWVKNQVDMIAMAQRAQRRRDPV